MHSHHSLQISKKINVIEAVPASCYSQLRALCTRLNPQIVPEIVPLFTASSIRKPTTTSFCNDMLIEWLEHRERGKEDRMYWVGKSSYNVYLMLPIRAQLELKCLTSTANAGERRIWTRLTPDKRKSWRILKQPFNKLGRSRNTCQSSEILLDALFILLHCHLVLFG